MKRLSFNLIRLLPVMLIIAASGCRTGQEIGSDDSQTGSTVLHPFPHITVRVGEHVVEFEGFSILEAGWLEQVVCVAGTRDHESLVVTMARPSEIHAALLLAGFEPGQPGRWSYENNAYTQIAPSGDAIDVFVRYLDTEGDEIEEPIGHWIRDHLGRREFPDMPWVFGGSIIAPNPERLGPGEHYVADFSGSVIGLVTFGDEPLGWSTVLSDQLDVQPAEWEVHTANVPEPQTPVTIVLRRARPR